MGKELSFQKSFSNALRALIFAMTQKEMNNVHKCSMNLAVTTTHHFAVLIYLKLKITNKVAKEALLSNLQDSCFKINTDYARPMLILQEQN